MLRISAVAVVALALAPQLLAWTPPERVDRRRNNHRVGPASAAVDLTRQNGVSYVRLRAYDSLGVYRTQDLAVGDLGASEVLTPSIAITPGDFLHVVWCQAGRVCCRTTLQPVDPHWVRQGAPLVWSDPMPVSEPLYEPASNCFVEAQGESLFVVWRGPSELGPNVGEIYRRRAWLQPPLPPQLLPTQRVSNSATEESDYPVAETRFATVWQEDVPGGREVYGQVNGQYVNLSNTPGLSSYPHCELLPGIPADQGQWRLFSIWTEEVVPSSQYQVRWSEYDFGTGFDGNPMMPFLWVAVGESIQSRYCLARDGYDRSGMPVDYATSRLAYRLPYMNPRKYYLLEAVAFQNKENETKQRVALGAGRWTLTLRRNKPETLRVVLPRGIYDTTVVNLAIEKLAGQRVTLAGLRLYEFEIMERKGDGQAGQLTGHIAEPTLAVHPNPFRRSLSVSYALPRPGLASVRVYDVAGKVVRCLASGNSPAGIRVAQFDGRDAKGRRVPAGVYVVRLETDDRIVSEKVVLSK